jgi:hypothetical protein
VVKVQRAADTQEYRSCQSEAAMEIEQKGSPIACHQCRYYQVTWDMQRPYGCRAHGFKTRQNPSLVVFESSGIECQMFEAKKRTLQ